MQTVQIAIPAELFSAKAFNMCVCKIWNTANTEPCLWTSIVPDGVQYDENNIKMLFIAIF